MAVVKKSLKKLNISSTAVRGRRVESAFDREEIRGVSQELLRLCCEWRWIDLDVVRVVDAFAATV